MVEQVTFQTIFQFLQTVSIMVGIAYYLMILRNQQESQQKTDQARKIQTFMQIHQRQNDQKEQETLYMLYNLEWINFEDYIDKYSAMSGHPEIAGAFDSQLSYYDGIGTMVKENMIDLETVYNIAGRRILMLWFKFETIVKGFRDPKWGIPDYGENLEYLAEEMIRIRKEKGLPISFTYLIHLTSELNEEYNR